MACLLLPAGALGDRYGRRGALLVGLTIFSLASMAPVFLDSPVQIIVARAVAGIGAALIMPATLSLLTAAFPKSERNKAVGIWAGAASSSAIFGFLGTGLLLHFFSWQSIFYAFARRAIVLFVLTLHDSVVARRIRYPARLGRRGADRLGARGVRVRRHRGARRGAGRTRSCGGAWPPVSHSRSMFAAVELRRRHPLLDVRLFGRPDFATGAIGITFLFFANFGFFFVAMQYMQLVMGYSPLTTAFALTPLALPIMVLGATMHLYLPKIGLRVAVALGLLLIGAGLFCMRFLDADSTYFDLAWPMMITAFGIGLCVAPTTSAIMNAVPDEKQGVASAVNDATREVGAAVGIAVAGSVLAAEYTKALAPGAHRLSRPGPRCGARLPRPGARGGRAAGPAGRTAGGSRRVAFLQSMDLALLVLSILLAVAAAFVAVWAPGRDGQQFGFVQRITRGGRVQTMNSAARWPSMTMVACGPRLVMAGSTEPSTTHSPSTPRTRHCGSTTAAVVVVSAHRRGAAQMLRRRPRRLAPIRARAPASSRASSAPARSAATSSGSLS